MGDESRTVWCGNLSDQVTEELLFELFLQVAPLERVRIPTDKEGRKSNFAFVTFKHEVSVEYAVQLLNGISLFNKRLNIKPRNSQNNNRNDRNQHNNDRNVWNDHQNNAPVHTDYPMNLLNLMQMAQTLQPNVQMQQPFDQREELHFERENRHNYRPNRHKDHNKRFSRNNYNNYSSRSRDRRNWR